MTNEELLAYYTTKTGTFSTAMIRKSQRDNDAYYQRVMELTPFVSNRPFSERLHIIRLGLNDNPSCVVCGNPTSFVRCEGGLVNVFRQTCSSKCMGVLKRGKPLNVTSETLEQAKDKRKQTMIERYGYTTNSQRPEIKPSIGQHTKTNEYKSRMRAIQRAKHPHIDYTILNDTQRLIELNQTMSLDEIAKVVNCSKSLVHHFFRYHNDIPIKLHKSYLEVIISGILDKCGVEYVTNTRKKLPSGKELDFYIPAHNLAIECNGLYWHCEAMQPDKHYHLAKTEECEALGIQLLHLFEHEITNKLDIVESMILAKLGLTTRIHARECTVGDVMPSVYKEFCENNHLQGYATAKEIKGLYYKDELVCLISVSVPRFNGYNVDYELVRFCTKLGVTVVGGFSRLLKQFEHHSIMSYANRRWSTGNVYKTNGFKHIKNTGVGFFYVRLSNTVEIASRYADRRPLAEVLADGFNRVFDCGNMVFIRSSK